MSFHTDGWTSFDEGDHSTVVLSMQTEHGCSPRWSGVAGQSRPWLGSDPDLTATVTEYDSWSGACWALVRFELGSGATTSQKASFRFHFELCDDAGCVDFCDAEVCGASASTQDRTVTILLP